MEYRITELPEFAVTGKAIRVQTTDGENFRRIPEFWAECNDDGTVEYFSDLAAGRLFPHKATLGICSDFARDMSECTYMIGAEKEQDKAIDNIRTLTIPSSTWAVFEAVGPLPGSIQSVWRRIWTEFFGVAEYEHGPAPDFELYPPCHGISAEQRCEVWIPVTKKKDPSVNREKG